MDGSNVTYVLHGTALSLKIQVKIDIKKSPIENFNSADKVLQRCQINLIKTDVKSPKLMGNYGHERVRSAAIANEYALLMTSQ